MKLPRLYADFQRTDDEGRLLLTTAGTRDDLQRHDVTLADGLRATFYTDDTDDEGFPDDLLAEGTVQWDGASRCWVAAIDWSTLRHASEEG